MAKVAGRIAFRSGGAATEPRAAVSALPPRNVFRVAGLFTVVLRAVVR
jgi:hypothetical protein